MKRLIKMFAATLIISVAMTQLILFIGDMAGWTLLRQRSVSSLIYLSFVAVSGFSLVAVSHVPRLPAMRLREILETEGYTPAYYAIMVNWRDKCKKRGAESTAQLTLAEALIDGGHTREGLDILGTLSLKKLDRAHKQVYYNTLLYAAVCSGEESAAERVYKSAEPWLCTVTSKALAPSIKHTLGCFEYMRGDIKRAEALFMQGLDSKPSPDVICELRMALTLCYLDSGRYSLAKTSADAAAQYAATAPLREKLQRTRLIAENTFRNARSEGAQ